MKPYACFVYCQQDADAAGDLLSRLRAQGFCLRTGGMDVLDGSAACIAWLSETACGDAQVRAAIQRALDRDIRLLPLRDGTPLSPGMRMLLSATQWLEGPDHLDALVQSAHLSSCKHTNGGIHMEQIIRPDGFVLEENGAQVLTVTEDISAATATLVLQGSLSSRTALPVDDELRALVSAGLNIVLDVGGVSYMAHWVIDKLMDLRSHAAQKGLSLRIVRVPAGLAASLGPYAGLLPIEQEGQ